MLSLFAKACPTFVIPARLLSPWDSPGKKWVAISFSGGSSQPRNQTLVSCIGRWIPYPWAVELLLILAQVVPDVTFRKPPVVHLLVRSPLICRLPEVTVSPPRAVPSLHCLKRNIFTLLKCFWSSEPVVMYRLFLLSMNHVLLLLFLSTPSICPCLLPINPLPAPNG